MFMWSTQVALATEQTQFWSQFEVQRFVTKANVTLFSRIIGTKVCKR